MNDIEIFSLSKELVDNLEQHLPMMRIIQDNLPIIKEGSDNFMKTQSQFMDNMLTIHHPTPIRNLRQILAEINKSLQALREAHYNIKRKEIEVKKYERKLLTEEDDLERELIQVEIDDRLSGMEVNKGYISGAIRKITNYMIQYRSILDSIGVKSFDEIDFEKEEERYHIMTAFDQALTAARTHNGIIDEGNHIYFMQIGINGSSAQREILIYLSNEGKLIQEGKEPTHEMILQFLNDMAEKYKGCSIHYATKKGLKDIISKEAALGG